MAESGSSFFRRDLQERSFTWPAVKGGLLVMNYAPRTRWAWWLTDMGAADRVTGLLGDPDPLLRAAAAEALRSPPPEDRPARL